MNEKEIKELLKGKIEEKRYKHTIAVADTAERIARKIFNSRDELKKYDKISFLKKVRLAALLHDYAKDLSYNELMSKVTLASDEWKIDAEELLIPQVLHAPVSAYLAKNELGIEDMEILEAIRYHTIGSASMGIVAQIIFAADFVEPNRDFSAAEKVRNELKTNGLESGIIMICDLNIKYNIEYRKMLHPNTVLLRNAYLRRQT